MAVPLRTFSVASSSGVFGLLLFLCMATSSFDIALLVWTSPTVRFAQLCILALAAFWLVDCGRRGRVVVPIGWQPLLLWICFVLLGILNANGLVRPLGYAAWLIIDALTVFVVTWLVSGRHVGLVHATRYYYLSFVIVSIIGFAQFLCAVLFRVDFYVTEWWINGILPRVNGLSYEPSYFATYLIPGWIMSEFFVVERAWSIVPRKLAWCCFVLVTVALVLSSSRMGIAVMVLWLVGDVVRRLLTERRGHQLRRAVGMCLFMFSLLAASLLLVAGHMELDTLLAGLGVHGASAHSIEDRLGSAHDVVRVIEHHPVVGVSLGGVAEAIAQAQGVRARGYEQTKAFEGQNVFLEVIAGSGWLGSVPFFVFLAMVGWSALRLRAARRVDLWIIRSLVYGLIMQFVVLQFNQNVLRPYVWIHIAMVCGSYMVISARNGGKRRVLVY